MIAAFSTGFAQLSDPAARRVIWLGLFASLAVFAVLWTAIGFLLANTALIAWGWLETLADLLGWLATGIFSWFLFPAVISAVILFMLDDIAKAVEARHYPHLPPAQGAPLAQTVVDAAKFLFVAVLLNLVLLVFLFVPPLFPFVFYGMNGYLLSREYFEMVALRRVPSIEARTLRKAHRGRLFLSGVAIAFLLTVPVVNLLAPIVATAAMVHMFESWRGA